MAEKGGRGAVRLFDPLTWELPKSFFLEFKIKLQSRVSRFVLNLNKNSNKSINTVLFDGCSLVSMKRKGKFGGNRNFDSPAP